MNLYVMRDNSARLRECVICEHYLHTWPHPKSLPFGYRLVVDGQPVAPDGRLWGCVVMKKPQALQMRGLYGYAGLPTAWQVLDLARVWVHPALQRKEGAHSLCVFSQMVGRVLRRVQADWLVHHPPRWPDQPYHILTIISYCELEHHDGTAYRASGFRWHGYSADRTKEVYVRHLRQPKKSWRPAAPAQMPLFKGVPWRHK